MKIKVVKEILRRVLSRKTAIMVSGILVLILLMVAVSQNGWTPTPDSITLRVDSAPDIASFQENGDLPVASAAQYKDSLEPRPNIDELASADQQPLSNTKTQNRAAETAAQVQRSSSEIDPAESDGERPIAATLPLIMVNLGDDIRFSEEGASVWTNMQRQFAQAFSRGTLDPSSPEYYERWQEVQAVFDERAQAMFGQDAYNAFSIRRARVSSESE